MHLLSSAGAALASWLPVAGAGLALCLYYPLYRRTMSAGITLNIATFVLWALLDSTNAGSTMFADSGGNWQLPLMHGVGSSCVAYAIYRTGIWELTWREGITAFFVGLSILLWTSVSSESAIVVSATGAVIAGVPMLVDWVKQPETAPFDICIGMLTANALGLTTLVLGADFDLEQHFYAAAGTLISTCYTLAAASRWFRHRTQSAA